jgi:hypothetical protein
MVLTVCDDVVEYFLDDRKTLRRYSGDGLLAEGFWLRVGNMALFPDAKRRENFSEQVIDPYDTCDGAKRFVRRS